MKKQGRPLESDSPQLVIGVDEAGRGCLAGPVFAGAVILNFPQKFQDSKQLSPRQRERLAGEIKKNHVFGVGKASVSEIESRNIHQASLLAMKRAVRQIVFKTGTKTARVLIDGLFVIKDLPPEFCQTALVRGDQRSPSIMAASIIAKTERDRLLTIYGKRYPEYGFERHKGYPVKSHKEAIRKRGVCPLHRKTFAGVRECI